MWNTLNGMALQSSLPNIISSVGLVQQNWQETLDLRKATEALKGRSVSEGKVGLM